jgi:hypothetical protein
MDTKGKKMIDLLWLAMILISWGAIGSFFCAKNYVSHGSKLEGTGYLYFCVIFGFLGPFAYFVFK